MAILTHPAIVPTKITNFSRNQPELQAFWLFCICVAGRNSDQVSKKVNALLADMPPGVHPFEWFEANDIQALLRKHKMGQYGRISKAIEQSLHLDLENATLEQLLAIHGVGPKTARFFILHTQKNSEHAVLDTHILRYMRESKFWRNVPKQTPQKSEIYALWEKRFVDLCRLYWKHLSIAEVDLMIWTGVSGRA